MIKGSRIPDVLRVTSPDLGAVTRSLLGVLLVAGLALRWGSTGAATAAAGAAAIAGATALQDSPRGRIPLVIAVSLEMGAAVLLGTLTSAYSATFVGVIAVWCFAVGMQWALGAHAGLVAAAASALLVTAPEIPPSWSSVLGSSALAVLGGLVQGVLIAIWPQHRWRVQRDALTRAYASLGTDAGNLATSPDGHVHPEALITLREAFTLSEGQARRRPPEYRGWYGLPERIAMTLSALAGRAGDQNNVAGVLSAAGEALGAIAGRTRSARRDADAALQRMDVAVGAVGAAEAPLAQRLSKQLHEAAALRMGDWQPGPQQIQELRRPRLANSLRWRAQRVRENLTRSSPILRHAVRLSGAAAAGTAIARFAGIEHGYWIALTVLMVLRPETAHTYTRCVGRIGGNAAGVVVASVVTMLWHPTGLASAVLAVIFLGVAYAVSGLSYLALSAALAASIVFLIDIDGVADAATLADRLVATLIGGVLAVLAHVLIPDDALVRLRQRAGELLMTEIDYAATVVKAFVHDLDHPADALAAAWQRAFRARAAFEAAAGATRLESRELRRWLRSFRAALNAVTSSCKALEDSLPPHPSAALGREFVLAVDDYVESLRGDPPTPATPWSIDTVQLAAADQLLRDAATHIASDDGPARVLVAEVGTITRSLTGITVDSRDVAAS